MKVLKCCLFVLFIILAFVSCNDKVVDEEKVVETGPTVKSVSVSLRPIEEEQGEPEIKDVEEEPKYPEFYVGDTFSKSLLIVNATYDNGTVLEDISNYNMSVKDGSMLTDSGEKQITVSFEGKSASIKINVQDNTSFEVKVPTNALTKAISYTIFTFNFNNRQDGKENGFLAITEGDTTKTYPYKWSAAGIEYPEEAETPTYDVTIDSTQFEKLDSLDDICEFTSLSVTIEDTPVTVKNEKVVVGIVTNKEDIKTEFFENEKIIYEGNKSIFDTIVKDDLEVYTLYSDGTKSKALTGYTVSREDTTVTVTYRGRSTTFDFTYVDEPEVASVLISKVPNEYYYLEGDHLDVTGTELTVTYVGEEQRVATIIAGFDPSVSLDTEMVGTENDISITYKNVTSDNTFPISFEKGIYILKPGALSALFSSVKDTITSIEITNDRTLPEGITEDDVIDLTVDGIKKVVAYLTEENTKLTIAGRAIYLNADSSKLFSGFSAVSQISGLKNLYTKNVTNMSEMFKGCAALTSVDISTFATATADTNLSSMFEGCSKLASVTLKDNVNSFDLSNVVNMSKMFKDCAKLTGINMNSLTTSKVADMSYMFSGCSELSDVDFTGITTAQVTNFSHLFENCAALPSLVLANFDTQNASDLSYMFSGCTTLDTVNITDLKTGTAADLNNMFSGCTNIESFTLSFAGESSIKKISDFLSGCTNLATVSITGLNTSTGTGNEANLGSMFTGSSALTSITLSDFNIASDAKFEKLFNELVKSGETAVTEVTLSGFSHSNKTSFKDLFYKCTAIKTITLTDYAAGLEADFSGLAQGCTNLTTFSFSGSSTSVPSVKTAKEMFKECSVLANITFENINTATKADFSHMFEGCEGFEEITLSGLNTENVTNMSYMFAECTGLKTVDLSGLNTQSATDLSYMFSGCTSLGSVNLADLKTGENANLSYMFEGCTSFINVDLSGFVTEKVGKMIGLFSGCTGLTSVKLEDLATGKDADLSYMFKGCTGFQDVDLSGFDTSNVVNMTGMFSGCTGLQSVDLSGLSTATGAILKEMFKGCTSCKTINLQGFDTSNAKDLSSMFSGCTLLDTVNMAGLSTGADGDLSSMFAGCEKLTTVYFIDPDDSSKKFDFSKVINTEDMFNGCIALTSIDGTNIIDLTGLSTGSVESMSGMFSGCTAITSVKLNGLASADGADLSDMFKDCTSLTSLGNAGTDSINFTGFDTSKVKNMSGMFSGSGLVNVNLTGLKTGTAADLSNMFENCANLGTTITGTQTKGSFTLTFDVSNSVKTVSNFLSGCSNLATVSITGLKTSTGTGSEADLDSMFTGSTALTSVTLSNFNIASDATIKNMFYKLAKSGENAVTEITLNGFTHVASYAFENMFNDCSGIKTITLTNYAAGAGANFSSMVNGCTNLTTFSFSGSSTSVPSVKTATKMFKSCTSLATVTLANLNTADKADLSYMFVIDPNFDTTKDWPTNPKTSALTTFNLDSFDTSNAVNMSAMFALSTELDSFDPTTINTSNTTNMSYMFAGCPALKSLGNASTDSINFTNFNTTKVKNMSGMFSGSGLVNVNLTGLKTGTAADLSNMFSNCTSLGTTISGTQTNGSFTLTFAASNSVKTISNFLSGCTNLATVSITGLKTSSDANLEYMFHNNTSITSLKLYNFVFANTTGLENMIDNSVNGTVELSGFRHANNSVFENMFHICENITSIKLVDYQTGLAANLSNMFYKCTGMIRFEFTGTGVSTSTVSYVKNMFRDCTSLTTAIFNPITIQGVEYPSLGTADKASLHKMFLLDSAEVPTTASAFTTIDLSGLDTSNAVNMSCMFMNCAQLQTLDLSMFKTSKVTETYTMFAYCSELKTIKINESNWNMNNVQGILRANGAGMFLRCSNIKGSNPTNSSYNASHTGVKYATAGYVEKIGITKYYGYLTK